MSKRPVLLCGGVAAAVCLAGVSSLVDAKPQRFRVPVLDDDVPVMVVPAGPDYLTTLAGSSHSLVSVPAGFFFEGSEDVATQVAMVGVPIGRKPARRDGFQWTFGSPLQRNHWTEPYDTRMVRYQDAVLPTIGSEATVDLKLDIVQLESPETIIVTGAGEVREYRVRLDLRPFHQEEGRTETMGWMHFTRTGYGTGKFTAEFYAWARYTFTPVEGGAPLIYDVDERRTIRVNDVVATRFYVPALLHASDIRAAQQEVPSTRAEGGGTEPSASRGCESGGCCCCEDMGLSACIHCPSM